MLTYHETSNFRCLKLCLRCEPELEIFLRHLVSQRGLGRELARSGGVRVYRVQASARQEPVEFLFLGPFFDRVVYLLACYRGSSCEAPSAAQEKVLRKLVHTVIKIVELEELDAR
ncbi:hypothetical protein SCOR_26895 [Sulfidibacter corallicola]|uniref:Uncharacterized protein n=1 Tax=Sulfidibacter corallicola TaxID=2818388 RepID=A0A8A4TMZ6_SULCO|nr:hypothetical protein [Sulfidibacter corallicola]QTD50817.1 hypothetical protein J3U87_34975 [Sulfidibacter corallicola]